MNSNIINYKKYQIIIENDECPVNPRDEYNLSSMVCFHGGYSLGDDHNYNSDDFQSFENIERQLYKDFDIAIIKPLYMYDHSGLVIRTSPFSCRFDSGQIGFVFLSKQAVRNNFNIKRVTKEYLNLADDIIENEVDTYNYYIQGECYRFSIFEPSAKEMIDCCSGFIGSDHNKSGLMDYAKESIEYNIIQQRKLRFNKIKKLIKSSVPLYLRTNILCEY